MSPPHHIRFIVHHRVIYRFIQVFQVGVHHIRLDAEHLLDLHELVMLLLLNQTAGHTSLLALQSPHVL